MLAGMAAKTTITVRLSRRDNARLASLSAALGPIAPSRSAVVSLLLRALPSASAILAAVARRDGADPLPPTVEDGSVPAAEVHRIHQDHDTAMQRLSAEHAQQLRRRSAEQKDIVEAAGKAAYEEGWQAGYKDFSASAEVATDALEVLLLDDDEDDTDEHSLINRNRLRSEGIEIDSQFGRISVRRATKDENGQAEGNEADR